MTEVERRLRLWCHQKLLPYTNDSLIEILSLVSKYKMNKAYIKVGRIPNENDNIVTKNYILALYHDLILEELNLPTAFEMWHHFEQSSSVLDIPINDIITDLSNEYTPLLIYNGDDKLTQAYCYTKHLYKVDISKYSENITNLNVTDNLPKMYQVIKTFCGNDDTTQQFITKCKLNPTHIQEAYNKILNIEWKRDFVSLVNYEYSRVNHNNIFNNIPSDDCIILINSLMLNEDKRYTFEMYKAKTPQQCLRYLYNDYNPFITLKNFKYTKDADLIQMKQTYVTEILNYVDLPINSLEHIETERKIKNVIDLAFYKFCCLGTQNNINYIQNIINYTDDECYASILSTLSKINIPVTNKVIYAFANCAKGCDNLTVKQKALYTLVSYKKASELLKDFKIHKIS